MCDNKSTNIKTGQDSFSGFLPGSQLLMPSVPPRQTHSFLCSMLLVRTYGACVISEGQWVAYLTQRWLRLKKKKKLVLHIRQRSKSCVQHLMSLCAKRKSPIRFPNTVTLCLLGLCVSWRDMSTDLSQVSMSRLLP